MCRSRILRDLSLWSSFIYFRVTAGVRLIIRFNRIIVVNKLNLVLLFISSFTIIISGVNALHECSLKKIIALSTLR